MEICLLLKKMSIIWVIFVNISSTYAVYFNITILDPRGYNISTSLEPITSSLLALDSSRGSSTVQPLQIKGIYVKCNVKFTHKDELCDITSQYCDLALERCESCEILCDRARMVGTEGKRVKESCGKNCPLYIMMKQHVSNVLIEPLVKDRMGELKNSKCKDFEESWVLLAIAVPLTIIATIVMFIIPVCILWKCDVIRHLIPSCTKKAKVHIHPDVEKDDKPDKHRLIFPEKGNVKQGLTDYLRKDGGDVRQTKQDSTMPYNEEKETPVKDIDITDDIDRFESQPLLKNPSPTLHTNTAFGGYNMPPHDPRPGNPALGSNTGTQTATDRPNIGLTEVPVSPGYSANTYGVMKDTQQLIHHADDRNAHDGPYITNDRRCSELMGGNRYEHSDTSNDE